MYVVNSLDVLGQREIILLHKIVLIEAGSNRGSNPVVFLAKFLNFITLKYSRDAG